MKSDPPPSAQETATENSIERFITLLSKLPGLGPRSARRAALALLAKKDTLLVPLAQEMLHTAETIRHCEICGNHATEECCQICRHPERSDQEICVVETVADLWAMERSGAFKGCYHVLGGTLHAVGNVRPEDLRIPELVRRTRAGSEVILALNATFYGQTTAHYIAEALAGREVRVTRIGFGVPIGGELDYLDADTIAAAYGSRLQA